MEKLTKQNWKWWWRLVCSDGLWSCLPPEMMAAIYDLFDDTMFICQEDLPLVITTSGKYTFLENLHYSGHGVTVGICICSWEEVGAAIRICTDNVEVNGCGKILHVSRCLGISVEETRNIRLVDISILGPRKTIKRQDGPPEPECGKTPAMDFRRVVIGEIIAREKAIRERETRAARCKTGKARKEKGRKEMARDNGRIKQKERLLPRW